MRPAAAVRFRIPALTRARATPFHLASPVLPSLQYKWGAAGAFKDIVTGDNDCTGACARMMR